MTTLPLYLHLHPISSQFHWPKPRPSFHPPKPSLHTGPKGHTNRHRAWHIPASGCHGRWPHARMQLWLGSRANPGSCGGLDLARYCETVQTGGQGQTVWARCNGKIWQACRMQVGWLGLPVRFWKALWRSGWSSGLQMQLELQPEMSDQMAVKLSRPTHGWRRLARCITWLMQAGP